jgi:hypothetical protein
MVRLGGDSKHVQPMAASWLARLSAEVGHSVPSASALEVSRALVECCGAAGSLLGEAMQELGGALSELEPPNNVRRAVLFQ